MVKDNLSTHKGERVRPLVRSVGCELLYLTPYSPDFSPIEEAFSKVKGFSQGRGREPRSAGGGYGQGARGGHCPRRKGLL